MKIFSFFIFINFSSLSDTVDKLKIGIIDFRFDISLGDSITFFLKDIKENLLIKFRTAHIV